MSRDVVSDLDIFVLDAVDTVNNTIFFVFNDFETVCIVEIVSLSR